MTRKYLTQDEVYRLMDAAQSMSFPERNRCLIMMAFIHGFRASELLDLRLSDIDASGKQLNIRRIKNGFSTTHPLLPDEYNLKETGFFSPGNAALSADNILFLSFVRLENVQD